MEGSPDFTASLGETRGVPVLRASGDIILGSASRFRAALEEAVEAVERTEPPGQVLVVDLSDTEFVDSVGLSTLIGSTKELRGRGGEVRLVGLSRPAMRMLEVTGLVSMFRVYPDVASATEDRRGRT